MLIYIVEDDTDIRELESYAMKSSGYEVQSFGESKSFFKACTAEIPQLVILDVMLPDFDGLSVLEKMRRDAVTKNVPVILVTAKGSEMDKVKGLDMGADDYITKPFSVLELISRVRAILRRCSVDDRQDVIKLGQIVFDDSKHIVTSCGEECNLTFKEYELLKYLKVWRLPVKISFSMCGDMILRARAERLICTLQPSGKNSVAAETLSKP